MRIEIESTPGEPIFEIPLEAEEERQRGFEVFSETSYKNRVAVYRMSAVPVEEPPLVAPCELADGDYVYSAVTIRLGLRPDRSCRFVRMRVDLPLGASISIDNLRPTACSLFPVTESDSVRRVRAIELSAGLTIKVDPATLTGPSSKSTTTVESDGAELNTIAGGLCSSEPYWDFRTTDARPELAGDYVLFLVAATPRGVAAQGDVRIEAEVRSKSGNRFKIFSKRPTHLQMERRFDLVSARS